MIRPAQVGVESLGEKCAQSACANTFEEARKARASSVFDQDSRPLLRQWPTALELFQSVAASNGKSTTPKSMASSNWPFSHDRYIKA